MDLEALPAALAAAGDRLEALEDTMPGEVAELILARTRPPRKTGALAATGRVDAGSVIFGGGLVDYTAPVHATNPFLAAAVTAAAGEVLDYAAAAVDTATEL